MFLVHEGCSSPAAEAQGGTINDDVGNERRDKARKGINPFTGEETVFKAKPATVKVKVRPMKNLKDAATA